MNDEMCVVVGVNDIIKKRRLLMWLECGLLNVLWDIYIYINLDDIFYLLLELIKSRQNVEMKVENLIWEMNYFLIISFIV